MASVSEGNETSAESRTPYRSGTRAIRLVVYTAIAGDYDDLVPPPQRASQSESISYVCLTDGGLSEVPGWTYLPLPRGGLTAQSRNRWVKFHPHKLFPDHDASIYIDGNIEVLADPTPLAVEVLQHAAMGLYDHPVRRCLYEEALECARIGFDWSPVIRAQVRRYAIEGYPRNRGLYEANIIVRAHHDPSVVRAMEDWWKEWESGVKRDQLSLMYVLWKAGLEPYALGRHDARFTHRYFQYRRHRHAMTRTPSRLIRQLFNRADLLAFGL